MRTLVSRDRKRRSSTSAASRARFSPAARAFSLRIALRVGLLLDLRDGYLRRFPLLAQRVDHGRHDEPLDVGAGRVVRAELVPLARIERAFEQRAEDGRFDLAPVRRRGPGKQFARLLRDPEAPNGP